MMEKTKAKSKKKSFLSRGEFEVPAIVKNQTRRGFLIGGGIFLAGIIFSAITKHLYMVLFGLILGAIIGIINYIKEIKLSRTGYKTLEGVCIKVEYPILKKGQKEKEPKRFLVAAYSDFHDNEMIFSLPYSKGNEKIEVNDKVIIYTENNPAYYISLADKNGFVGIGGLIGYISNGFITPNDDDVNSDTDFRHKTMPNSDFSAKR